MKKETTISVIYFLCFFPMQYSTIDQVLERGQKLDDLVEKAKKLGIKLNDKQKRNICVLLEYYLREYDERKKDGRSWFKDCVQEIRERGGFVKKS